ncbi:hypothetical protein [Anatilimnocola floriformis]|uniref:hypothetical protein n=1 Tax=Anatilimnocola floriformis TaxID=2948575 RepID=UPI0020C244EB|nr:hypothetical protein [Anatilimnocola floriformis]
MNRPNITKHESRALDVAIVLLLLPVLYLGVTSRWSCQKVTEMRTRSTQPG